MNPKIFPALALLFTGCATNIVKTVDRAASSPSKGYVEFRITQGDGGPSMMREPAAIFITPAGESKPIGFVGSDFNWAPWGYVTQLRVAETPGKHSYAYRYATMGKNFTLMPPVGIVTGFENLTHRSDELQVIVPAGKTIPVTFALGTREIAATGIASRLDPSQFTVIQGSPY